MGADTWLFTEGGQGQSSGKGHMLPEPPQITVNQAYRLGRD